ncbi:toll/interleukin-1 receptor domain-containing protein [Paracidobacterium acidisoli]|uniref:Toll/interleukin-1 receptor domain-containing protein n=1 Tax=Paracidobacterium acidisoli TaxID=2303751 RepID=A0A372IPI8_9BACT|nr:toll/interleukin-1 receptor domain-containing protein [Paracidobacterium acidisoli]MBT9331186.1 toll/interleukin-1 receptor domain-containing protein [Paracidobacterium acidisoli]
MTNFDFDVFISHASEDKAGFVTSLSNELRKHGLKVWFDKFTLKVGDSLHRSIEKGLARSRYGVVVFSPKFLTKNWPQAELDGLFAREMDGHKVILPIWHNISSARMKDALPMLADKVALRSSDGIEAVARSLVEVIRPELLELDNKKASAFEAADTFMAEARRKHPGYDFAIQSGSFSAPKLTGAPSAIANAKQRIQISVSDPAIIGTSPGGRIEFFGEGARKAIEFVRTGKPQKWESGEFRLLDWNVPLMPTHVEGSTLEVGIDNNLLNIPPKYMRVEVRSRPPIVFPIMEMKPVRLGTDEVEAILSDKETPLSISLVFSVGSNSLSNASREIDFTLSWETTGKKISECKNLIEAIDALRRGNVLRLIDIRLDKPIFESKARVASRTDPFAGTLRRTVLLASQIEKEFSVSLRMPEVVSEEDGESLLHLDCLLNDHPYQQVNDTQLRLTKADGEVGAGQLAFIRGELSATYTDVPSNYPGYFPLFGQQIATRNWVRVVELVPKEPCACLKEFSESPIGTQFSIEITAKGPVFLRWRDDSILRNIEVGSLAQLQL